MTTVYFDIDNTINKFYQYPNWLKLLVAEDTTPYSNCAPIDELPQVLNVCRELQEKGVKIGVITWGAMDASREYNRAIKKAKKEWLEKYFPCVEEYHCIKYGTPKYKAAKNENGILIDDTPSCREEWPGKTYDEKNILQTLKKILAAVDKVG